MTRLIDLTHPWGTSTPPFVGLDTPRVTVTHRFGTHRTFMTKIETAMHVGTHIDAPCHFVEGAGDMASLPLDRLYGDGVIVDISDSVGEWDVITPKHITSKMEVRPGEILVYYTGWSRYYTYGETPDEVKYMYYQPGGTRELAEWIVKMRFKWTGFDCITSDHPMLNYPFRVGRPDLVAEYRARTGIDVDRAYPLADLAVTHKVPFQVGIVHVENIGGDIRQVLNRRCKIGAFPWRFVGGEASICRVVAFLDD